jgi:hypothetical protein
MKWVGYVTHMGEIKFAYITVVCKPTGKKPPGRPRCSCEDTGSYEIHAV